MSRAEDGKSWSLVAATGLEADETVLDNVNTSDTVAASDSVGLKEELKGSGDGLALDGLNSDWNALLKDDGEVLWLIWSLEWVDGELPHVGWCGIVWVLKITGLVRAVSSVLIHRPWLGLAGGNWNAGSGGVLEKIIAASETVVELWKSPWGDDFDIWLESKESELETDLVVTFSGAAVGNDSATLLLGDIDHATGDYWASKGGTEEVDTLVDGVTLNSWNALLVDELLTDVNNVAGNGSDGQSLLLGNVEVLLLANVGHHTDDIVTLLDEPLKDAGGVETTGVGESATFAGHFVICVDFGFKVKFGEWFRGLGEVV